MYRNGKEGQGFESPLRLEPLCDRGSKPQVRVARAAAAGRLLVTGGGVAQRQSKRLIIAVSRVRFPPPLRVSPPESAVERGEAPVGHETGRRTTRWPRATTDRRSPSRA